MPNVNKKQSLTSRSHSTSRVPKSRGGHAERKQKTNLDIAKPLYLVRVMWALLKRGTVWEENLALAK
jgi:hypothetical protein